MRAVEDATMNFILLFLQDSCRCRVLAQARRLRTPTISERWMGISRPRSQPTTAHDARDVQKTFDRKSAERTSLNDQMADSASISQGESVAIRTIRRKSARMSCKSKSHRASWRSCIVLLVVASTLGATQKSLVQAASIGRYCHLRA